MNHEELFDELTYIDDDLILEAYEEPASRRSPLRLRSLRRVAALIAAVMVLVGLSAAAVAVANDGWNLRLLNLWQDSAPEQGYHHFWRDSEIAYDVGSSTISVGGQNIPFSSASMCSTEKALDLFVCNGYTLEARLEAMILLEDGSMAYKSHTIRGSSQLTNELDNRILEETGTILNVRRTFSVLVEDEWIQFYSNTSYLPSNSGVLVPTGTDARFPDMRYNYDGRKTQDSSEDWDSEAQVILQNDTDIIMVLRKSD